MKTRKLFYFSATLILLACASAIIQDTLDHSGKYAYAIVDTPYGDYSGFIILKKKDNTYQGEVINEEGIKYDLSVVRSSGNRIIFRSNIEETNSILHCEFFGDSIRANVEVKGDDFPYVLKGTKIK